MEAVDPRTAMEGTVSTDVEVNKMGQYEFSKGVMEKILRRAFLDGVIELYENCPFGRINSVALEGDLSLTINKYETFDIRLFEIAQRAPEKKVAISILKTESSPNETFLKTESSPNETFLKTESSPNETLNKTDPSSNETLQKSEPSLNETHNSNETVLKTENKKIKFKIESSRVTSPVDKKVTQPVESFVNEKIADKNMSTKLGVTFSKVNETKDICIQAESKDDANLVTEKECPKTEIETSPCAKPVYIYDDGKDDGTERNVTDDNSAEVKSETSELEDCEDEDLECQLIDTTSKECETILIDDEEEVVVNRVPDIVCESKVKRRRTDLKHSIPKRLGPRVDECDSSSSPGDNFYSACPLCSAMFCNSDYFIMHIETHRQQLGQSCLICSQGNLQTDGYLYHLATHHGTSLIQAAADLSGLAREGLASTSSRQPQFPVVKSEGEFRCLQCGHDFMTIDMLENHAETHRLEELEAEKEEALHTKMLESKERSYSCELCSEVFSQPGSLAEHHRQEHGLQMKGQMSLYVNDHNDDSSSEEAAVLTHRNMDVFTCHRCTRSFRSWRSLKYHYLTTHGLQYTCEVCRNAFSSQHHLQIHEQTHVSTSSDPVFKCSICDKTFPTMTHCTAHKRSHTSAKPHTCDLCGSCFFKRGDLTKHVRTVHCPKKHFVCKICGRTGTRSDNMRVHVKLHQKFMSRDQVDQLIEEVYNK